MSTQNTGGFGRQSITPDVTLIAKSGEVNYSFPQAIFELSDNSIDNPGPREPLEIDIRVGQRDGEKYVSHTDNGSGMTPQELADAMVMARSNKSGSQIGEFGFGLKAASSFLGKRVEIVTCTPDMESAARLVYDEAEFIKAGKWEIEVEEVEKPFDHGTAITITNMKVNVYAGLKNTLLEACGKTYRHFIAARFATIRVNGTDVEPITHETMKEYDTEIDFEVGGRRVRGWASLAPHGSGKGKYGWDLIRHNRVMAEHEKIGFPATHSYQYFVGELHLDDFPVTNNKTAFRVDTKEWKLLGDELRQYINDLLRASRAKANPGRELTKKQKQELDNEVEEVTGTIKGNDLVKDLDRRVLDAELAAGRDEDDVAPIPFPVPGEEGGDDSEPGADGGDAGQPRVSSVTQHRLNAVKTTLRDIKIEHRLLPIGKDTPYKIWEAEGVGSSKKVIVTTNINHPFFESIGDSMTMWIKHNVVEAVAEFITEETGTAEAMMLVKSDILKHVGKLKLNPIEEEIDFSDPVDDNVAETA